MEQMSFLDELNSKYKVENFSAANKCEDLKRRELEEHYFNYVEITDKFNRQTVSFQKNKTNVVHRWLKYKEGFSAELVEELLKEMNLDSNSVILDPFIGSGTTALVCHLINYSCIGFDILPTSKLAIDVKSNISQYNVGEIEELIEEFKNIEVANDYQDILPYTTITKGAYPYETDRFLAYITQWINTSKYSSETKSLFLLSVVNSLEEMSYTIKSGQYLSWDCRAPKVIEINKQRKEKGQKEISFKKVRETIAAPKDRILLELEKMLYDIRSLQKTDTIKDKTLIDFRKKSVLFELPLLEDNSISGVITSPPYCNRYDYTRTYALELSYLGVNDIQLKKLRQELLSCTVESKSKESALKSFYQQINEMQRYESVVDIIQNDSVLQEVLSALKKRQEMGEINNNGILRMVEGYFTELCFIYAELYRVCKKGAVVAFVNDNVRYGGEVIPVDFISTAFAEKVGFKIRKIYVLKQQKGNSSQQMAKYGRVPLRKSITIWYK